MQEDQVPEMKMSVVVLVCQDIYILTISSHILICDSNDNFVRKKESRSVDFILQFGFGHESSCLPL